MTVRASCRAIQRQNKSKRTCDPADSAEVLHDVAADRISVRDDGFAFQILAKDQPFSEPTTSAGRCTTALPIQGERSSVIQS